MLDAADERLHITEHEVRHRDARHRDAESGQVGEVAFGDEGVAVGPESLQLDLLTELLAQAGLVLRGRALEQVRTHPLLQDQPIAEVDTFDHDLSL